MFSIKSKLFTLVNMDVVAACTTITKMQHETKLYPVYTIHPNCDSTVCSSFIYMCKHYQNHAC